MESLSSKLGGGWAQAGYDPLGDHVPETANFAYNDLFDKITDGMDANAQCVGIEPNNFRIIAQFNTIENQLTEDALEVNQYFYHPDHLGSSSFITNASGDVDQHLQYLPFGEPWIDQRTQNNIRFTFSGKERDEETGYNYFGARYYNSDVSIWLSVDPLSDQAPGWTPYRYGFNNPIQFVDPNGMFESKAEAKQWAKDNGIRTGLFSRNNIDRGSDGSFSVNDMKNGISYSRSDEQFPSMIEGEGFSELVGRGSDGVNWQTICSEKRNSWVDNVQTGLDIAGIADPTGVIDFANGVLYGLNGNWKDAAISMASILPFGDALKAGRLGTKTLQLTTKTRTAERGLEIGQRFLGAGYKEIAPGVFRSSDELRQFRMTDADILHSTPHFNFEIFSPNNLNKPTKNYHMPLR